MSHGGGGGFGHSGGGGSGHHGIHGGGEPDMSASWNMAYVGEKRTGLMARFNPLPIFIGLLVFAFMIMPFVMDWNEPHLQRLLIGHDLTAKEIAHQNAIDQVMAGMMRSKAKKAFGDDVGGMMIPDAEPLSGADLISEPAPPAASAPSQPSSGSGLSGFSLQAVSPVAPAGGQTGYGQQAGFSQQMAPAQNYMQGYPQPGNQTLAPVPPTVGFSNQRIISQPPRASYGGGVGGGVGSGIGSSGIDYRAPRHRVMVER